MTLHDLAVDRVAKQVRGKPLGREEVIDAMIKLAQNRPEGEPISNKEIYSSVTKRKRYNRKAWEELKAILGEIAGKTIRSYLFFTYNPMLASRYNFPVNRVGEWGVYCAGFQLWKRK